MTSTINLNRERPVSLERIRLGKSDGPPIGVVVRVDKADLAVAGALVDELLAFAQAHLAKARLPRAIAARNELFAEVVPSFRAELVGYFEGLLARAGVAKADDPLLDPDDIDWPAERTALRRVLATYYATLGEAAYGSVARELALELTFDLEAPATEAIRGKIANAVTAITDRTRELIRAYVTTATDRGYSIAQLVAGVDGDGFLGLGAIFGERAQVIALTETANAYNAASVAGWRESGIVEEVVVFDGPECGWTEHDDPDLADGTTRTLDEADEFPISHPNCQRAFGPVALT